MTQSNQPTQPLFSPATQWIWGADDHSATNIWRYFRKGIEIGENVQRATLLITADSCYEVSLEAAFVGRGPIRGFPWAYPYDVYDLTALVRRGEVNTITVLVNHLGDHTMSYIRGAPGFLCELVIEYENGQIERIGTDSSWLTAPCLMFNNAAPRISIQLPFEEQIDARLDVQHWATASEIGAIGCDPWTTLTARPIPFLTHDPIAPTAIKAIELARPRPGTIWSFDIRKQAGTMRTGIHSAPPGERGMLLFTEIMVAADCTVQFHNFPNYEQIVLRVNDSYYEIQEEPTEITLKAGANLVMLRDAQWFAVLFETTEVLSFSADRFVSGAAWAGIGSINETNGELDQSWKAAALDELRATKGLFGIAPDENKTDIFALTSSQQFFSVPGGFCTNEITRATPRPPLTDARPVLVDHPSALLHDSADWTTVHPQPDGDTHILIDFGREVIGYLEVEFNAPDGAIVDGNLFEGIDDGGIFWTRGLRNSFRYIAREGRQVFTSHQRRGFRYLSLTLRQFTRPITIRQVRCLLSTYPVEAAGSFACSDEALNHIWSMSAYTLQLCMLDTYVDCPAYEQVYWVGDTRSSALVNAATFGAFDLTRHCILLTAESLSEKLSVVKPPYLEAQRTHLTTSHVVSGWFDEIPMWTFLWIWSIYEHYHLTADLDLLESVYPAVKECLRRCEIFLTERDLLDIPDIWNLVEWAAMDLERYGEVISNTVMMVQSLRHAATFAERLDKGGEAQGFMALAERLKIAVNRYGWSDTYQGYMDTVRDEAAYARYVARLALRGGTPDAFETFNQKQRYSEQTNCLAYLCGCVPLEREAQVFRYILAARDGQFKSSSPWEAFKGSPDQVVPIGTPWFLSFALEALCMQGRVHESIDIIRREWGKMLEKGATTCWETFPGMMGKHWSRSLCHGWSTMPAYLLSTFVLGVTVIEPGYKRIRISPSSCNLAWAKGTIPTPLGTLSVAWQRDQNGEMHINYDAPPGCIVEIE